MCGRPSQVLISSNSCEPQLILIQQSFCISRSPSPPLPPLPHTPLTPGLRYFPADHVRALAAEALSPLLRQAGGKASRRGLRALLGEVVVRPSQVGGWVTVGG